MSIKNILYHAYSSTLNFEKNNSLKLFFYVIEQRIIELQPQEKKSYLIVSRKKKQQNINKINANINTINLSRKILNRSSKVFR